MDHRLLFVIGTPRSGTTMLQRMLGSHSEIYTRPEPHLITPLAHLGPFGMVDKAPYDHINSAEAMRLFVEGLPHGEQDYLDAVFTLAGFLKIKIFDLMPLLLSVLGIGQAARALSGESEDKTLRTGETVDPRPDDRALPNGGGGLQ